MEEQLLPLLSQEQQAVIDDDYDWVQQQLEEEMALQGWDQEELNAFIMQMPPERVAEVLGDTTVLDMTPEPEVFTNSSSRAGS